MKKILTLIVLFSIALFSYAQKTELSQKECQSKIRTYWNDYNEKKAREKVSKLCLENPNNETSLTNLYLLRKYIDKTDLEKTLNNLQPGIISNDYAKSLDLYVKTEQLKKGDRYFDFSANTIDSKEFTLSDVASQKDVLLIFYGLDCMGEETLAYLINLYSKLDLNKVDIISVSKATSVEKLLEEKEYFEIPWNIISDFGGDHSEAKIIYDVQARPTSVFISSEGTILLHEVGINKKTIKVLEKYIME